MNTTVIVLQYQPAPLLRKLSEGLQMLACFIYYTSFAVFRRRPPLTSIYMRILHTPASLVQAPLAITRQHVTLTPLSILPVSTQLLSSINQSSRPQIYLVSHACHLRRILQIACLAAAGLRLCPVGSGGRTYAPIPRGAHTLSTKRPWLCSVSTETHPGSPETDISATLPGALMLSVACNHIYCTFWMQQVKVQGVG